MSLLRSGQARIAIECESREKAAAGAVLVVIADSWQQGRLLATESASRELPLFASLDPGDTVESPSTTGGQCGGAGRILRRINSVRS